MTIKVLVVDDEMLVRRGIVLETDWKALGCVVVAEAENGEEGLQAARKYQQKFSVYLKPDRTIYARKLNIDINKYLSLL